MLDFNCLTKMYIEVSNFDIQVHGQTNHVPHMPYVVYDLWNQRKQVGNVNLGKIEALSKIIVTFLTSTVEWPTSID